MSTYYNSKYNHIILNRQKMSARDWEIAKELRSSGVSTYELALAFGITRRHLLDWTSR